jgi:hypothetical protein
LLNKHRENGKRFLKHFFDRGLAGLVGFTNYDLEYTILEKLKKGFETFLLPAFVILINTCCVAHLYITIPMQQKENKTR